jgi:hypothetical protein
MLDMVLEIQRSFDPDVQVDVIETVLSRLYFGTLLVCHQGFPTNDPLGSFLQCSGWWFTRWRCSILWSVPSPSVNDWRWRCGRRSRFLVDGLYVFARSLVALFTQFSWHTIDCYYCRELWQNTLIGHFRL